MGLTHGQLIGLAILAVIALIIIVDWRWGTFSGHRPNKSAPREPLYQKDLDAAAEWDANQRSGRSVLENLRQLHAARYGYVRRPDGTPVDVGVAAPPEPGNGHHRLAAMHEVIARRDASPVIIEPEPVPEPAPPLDPLPEQDERTWGGTLIGQQLHHERPYVEVPESVLEPTAVMSREQLVADRVRAHYEALETQHWGWLNHEVEVAKRRSTEEWRGWSMLMMRAVTA